MEEKGNFEKAKRPFRKAMDEYHSASRIYPNYDAANRSLVRLQAMMNQKVLLNNMRRYTMPEYQKVAATGDISPGSAKAVELVGKRIALFNLGGTYFAIDDGCPHRGGPLSEGLIEGESVTCPWHGSVFNIKTGAVETPPAKVGVAAYKVRVQGNDVEVEV